MLRKLGYLLIISLVVNLQPASCNAFTDFFRRIFGIGANKEDPTYKLHYFDGRGRAEFIRWIFKASGKKFEDIRIKDEDWDALKPTYPFGQLPVLDIIQTNVPLTRLAQSVTIARFLAKRFGLSGNNEMETAFSEMYGDQVNDLFNKLLSLNENPASFNQTVIDNFKFFEDRLTKNNGYFSGSQLTYSDLYLSSITDMLGKAKGDFLKEFPKITELDNKVRNIPGIKDWIASRPITDY